MIDEIQEIESFEKAVRDLNEDDRYDVFCTGSNATLLSGHLASLLAGRYIEINSQSLSYNEFYMVRPWGVFFAFLFGNNLSMAATRKMVTSPALIKTTRQHTQSIGTQQGAHFSAGVSPAVTGVRATVICHQWLTPGFFKGSLCK